MESVNCPGAIGSSYNNNMISCDLKRILRRRWNQLLAASTQKSSDSSIKIVAPNCILEPPIAESANWKLSLAESAKVIRNTQFCSIWSQDI